MNSQRLACAVGLGCLLMLGQALPAPAQGTPTQPGSSDGPTWDLEVVDGALHRHDGKQVPADLRTVISYLRNRKPANVVLAPGVGEIQVTDLKLTNFEWEQGLEALKVASGDAFIWSRRGGAQEIDPTTGLASPFGGGQLPSGQPGSELYVLTANPEPITRRSARAVEVFNLSNYLRENDPAKAIDDIRSILVLTLQEMTGGGSSGPNLQFHRSAGLLIVIGTHEEIAVARQIIMALPEVSSSKPVADPLAPALRRYGIYPGEPVQPPPAQAPRTPRP